MGCASFLRAAGLVAAVAGSAQAAAQTFDWPSASAPCNGTLQDCVNGVIDNALVRIDTNTPTNLTPAPGANLNITHSVRVTAAPGRSPVFPDGISIVIDGSVPSDVSVSGLTLRAGGQVSLNQTAGSGTGSLRVERMRFENLGVAGQGVNVQNHGSGTTLEVRLRDNDYIRTGGAGNFAVLAATPGAITGEVSFNRVEIPDGSASAYGILLVSDGDSAWTNLVVAGNRLHGSFQYGAICGIVSATPALKLPVSQWTVLANVVTAAQRGAGVGLCLFPGEGYADAKLVNNTLVDLGIGIRVEARPFPPLPTVVHPMQGEFANNLLAHNNVAVLVGSGASTMTNRSNLYFGNGSNGSGYVAGSGSRYDDPRLFSRSQPYLLASSPAIDAGSNAAWPGPAVWPSLDADGHRRAKRGAIDIGAYEQGDGWFDAVATAANTTGNTLLLDHPTSNGAPSARVFATPNFSLGAVTHTDPFGVYWHIGAQRWRVFNEALLNPMPIGAGYNLFSPAAPDGSGLFPDLGLLLHRVPGAGSASSVLSDPSLDDRTDQIVLVGQNWNPQDAPASSGIYNNSLVTLQYLADNRWRITNVGGAFLPSGSAFNVYAQPPSPSAFRHVVAPGNLSLGSTFLSHPLLDGKPCARIQATSIDGDRPYDVYYAGGAGRWAIYNASGFTDGARFNVLFSPRQIEECSGPQVFSDGFE